MAGSMISMMRITRDLSFFSQDQLELEISILMMDDTIKKIPFRRSTRASELIEDLAQKIFLIYFEDFRLFIKQDNNNMKLIDEDEYLFRFFNI